MTLKPKSYRRKIMTGGSLPLEGIITKVNLQTQSSKINMTILRKKTKGKIIEAQFERG